MATQSESLTSEAKMFSKLRCGVSLVLCSLAVSCTNNTDSAASIDRLQQAAVSGADDRTAITAAFLQANPRLKAVGRLASSATNTCTASKINHNYLITAGRCLGPGDFTNPSAVVFYPGELTSAAQQPSVRAKRVVRGDDSTEPGSNFALIEVDLSTYDDKGTGLQWSAIEPLALSGQAGPPPPPMGGGPGGFTVSSAGYSSDLNAAIHRGCTILSRKAAAGIYGSDCDFKTGALGGPVLNYDNGQETTIVAINGEQDSEFPDARGPSCTNATGSDGVASCQASSAAYSVCWTGKCGRTCGSDFDCTSGSASSINAPFCVRGLCRWSCASTLCQPNAVCQTQANGNKACLQEHTFSNSNLMLDTLGAYWAPFDATSVAALENADGRAHVYATDRARLNQFALRPMVTTTGPYHSRYGAWSDARGGMSVPTPRRLSGALHDSRQFVFGVSSTSQVFANWQSVPNGGLGGWADFFGGDPMTGGVQDIATDSTSPRLSNGTLFQYVLKNSGNLYLRRKPGAWNADWMPWQQLGTSTNLLRIAADNTEGYPVLVGTSAQTVQITWGTSPSGSAFVPLQPFGDGLPSSMCMDDIEIGSPNGILTVYLLGREGCSGAGSGTSAIWIRAKSTSSAGSAWQSWVRLYTSQPELAGATEIIVLPPSDVVLYETLMVVNRGAVFFTDFTIPGRRWLPFYGPRKPW